MGAKTKPQETVSLGDLGVDAGAAGEAGAKTTVRELGAAARARRLGQDRGRRKRPRRRSSTTSWRSGSCEVARLPRALPRRAGEGRPRRALQGRVARRSDGRRARRRRAEAATRAGAFGATKVYVCEAAALESPLPQPRVDALATLVEQSGADAVLFAASVLAADVAAGLAARLEAGLNWDLTDLVARGRRARRQAAGARGHGPGRRRLDGHAAARDGALGRARSRGVGRHGRGRDSSSRRSPTSPRSRRSSSRRRRSRAAPRSRTRTSSSPEAAGSARPRRSRCSRSSRRRSAARSARRARSSTPGWYPYATQVGQTGKRVAPEALRRLRDLRRDPAQGRHAGLRDDRRDQQGPERADLRLLRLRRRRRPAPDRPKLTELVRAHRG